MAKSPSHRIARVLLLLFASHSVIGAGGDKLSDDHFPNALVTATSVLIDNTSSTPQATISPVAASLPPSAAPSFVPHHYNSEKPSVAPGHTAHPAKATLAPTIAPHSQAPSQQLPTTASPSKAHTTSNPTSAPIVQTPSPSFRPHAKEKHVSFLQILGKAIAWLIILLLSFVAFGAIMSHRYRIYYFLRGCWFTFLRLDCTVWLLSKLQFPTGGGFRPSMNVSSSLNTIIFDNEMSEGLLMREGSD